MLRDHHTVGDILAMLQRRRVIPQHTTIKYHLYYPRFRLADLNDDDTIGTMGAVNGSTLHIRLSVPGGSGKSGRKGTCFIYPV